MAAKSIIFTHIQKTAGTSILNELIYANYAKEEIRMFWGGFGIKKLILTNTSNFKIFTGHFPYGIHHYIKQDCEYFTFLREPIGRAVSHYNFIKNNQGLPGDPNKYKAFHQNTPLTEIFNKTSTLNPFKGIIVDNMQTRFLAGYLYYGLPKNSKLMLKKAKENLKNSYKVFGLQERYNESIELITSSFDWNHESKDVREKKTTTKEPIDDYTLTILKENHLLDIELYNYAQELFEERWQQFKNRQ
jgi:hypothetical protein